MKLNKLQKLDLIWYKDQAKVNNAKVIHVPEVVTIVWQRAFKHSRMVLVATSYFDPTEQDRYRKSTGKFFALGRMFNGQYAQVPIGELDDQTIENVLKDMFVL